MRKDTYNMKYQWLFSFWAVKMYNVLILAVLIISTNGD